MVSQADSIDQVAAGIEAGRTIKDSAMKAAGLQTAAYTPSSGATAMPAACWRPASTSVGASLTCSPSVVVAARAGARVVVVIVARAGARAVVVVSRCLAAAERVAADLLAAVADYRAHNAA